MTRFYIWYQAFILELKEKLPQAFMQIGWVENDFRNLYQQVWANVDNPIKSYDFVKVLITFLHVSLSGGTQLQSMSLQPNTTV